MNVAKTLQVSLDGDRDYDIVIGDGLLSSSGKLFHDRFGKRRFFVVKDPRVEIHAKALEESLKNAGHDVASHTLIEGEEAKVWDQLQKTVAWLMDSRVDRDSMVIALGGGVTGDHAGFAAAITLRGLEYIQIPTTLLAQVDSSVGGKTGINAAQGKNLIGAFHQPRLVLADIATLATLCDRHMLAGYAEIIKYGFIGDPKFFEWLDAHGERVLKKSPKYVIEAISVSCKTKATIVSADERENAARALLNFGHTFAHALETACEFDKRLLHGEAVSIGMALAFDVSRRMGLCPQEHATKAIIHLKRLGLPTRIADIKGFPSKNADDLLELMMHDKKAKGGQLTFILTRGIGRAFISKDADIGMVKAALNASMGAT